MENLTFLPNAVMVCVTIATLLLLYRASNFSRTIVIASLVWIAIQGIVSATGFYTKTNSIPPRFILLLALPLVVIFLLFLTTKGKEMIDKMSQRWLTLLHLVRVPVELVLFSLFLHKYVPQLMTFEGRNFDILSGITSPIIFYFGYVRKVISRTLLLAWNLICLALLINILVNAVLSAPFPFQQFAFDRPNIAVLYFPFTWLPCFIVPAVLFSHLVCIRQLTRVRRVD